MYRDRYRVEPKIRAVEYHMDNNATPTSIGVAGTFYKAAGATSEGELNKGGFTLTDNRATYNGTPAYFKVDAIGSVKGGSNNIVAVRVAKNGTKIHSSQSRTTTTAGRAESAHAQTDVYLVSGDYVETYLTNTSGTTSITMVDLSVTVEEVK